MRTAHNALKNALKNVLKNVLRTILRETYRNEDFITSNFCRAGILPALGQPKRLSHVIESPFHRASNKVILRTIQRTAKNRI